MKRRRFLELVGKGVYRVRQLWWALGARPLSAEKTTLVQGVLNSAEFTLFQTFSHNDQQHSVRVLSHLIVAGHTDPSLHKAALLHDIGKTRLSLTILDRCIVVLGAVFFRDYAKRIARSAQPPYGWIKPFVIRERHPQWSAEMLAETDSDAVTIDLVRRHQDQLREINSETDRLLSLLQWADDRS